MLPIEPFITIAELAGAPGKEIDAKTVASTLLTSTNKQLTGKTYDLESILESQDLRIGPCMLAACSKKGATKAIRLSDFGSRLFGSAHDFNTIQTATQGLLIARDLCGLSEELPSFRLHWFFKNTEGLWACTQPGCGCDLDQMTGGRTTGQLFSSARILCENPDEPHRVLDLLYCEVCGTTMFGGNRFELEANNGWELLITDTDIEGIPDRQPARFVERRMYEEYGIFWPSGDLNLASDARRWQQPTPSGSTIPGHWRKASLNPSTGQVRLGNEGPVSGYTFVASGERPECGALPAVCPLCAVNYRYRQFRKSPIRGFRTGFGKVTQILSKEMFYFMPEDSKKLVVFSDSRQGAAELANGIERAHYSDLVREAMYDELRKAAIAEPALLADIQNTGRPTSPDALSLTLNRPDLLDAYIKLAKEAGIDENTLASLPDAAREALEGVIKDSKKKIAQIAGRGTRRAVPLRLLFEDENKEHGAGTLIQRLKTLGVNPAGQDILFQEFNYDDAWQKWTTLFDFSNPSNGWKPDLSPEGRERGQEKLRANSLSDLALPRVLKRCRGSDSRGSRSSTRLDSRFGARSHDRPSPARWES